MIQQKKIFEHIFFCLVLMVVKKLYRNTNLVRKIKETHDIMSTAKNWVK